MKYKELLKRYQEDREHRVIKPLCSKRVGWKEISPLKNNLTTIFKNETLRLVHLRDRESELCYHIPPFMEVEYEVAEKGEYGDIGKVIIRETIEKGSAITVDNKIPTFIYEREKRKK